jgi:hypothetical protein
MRSIEPDASPAQALDRHKFVSLGSNQLQVISLYDEDGPQQTQAKPHPILETINVERNHRY